MSEVLDYVEFILNNSEKFLFTSDGILDIEELLRITQLIEKDQMNFVLKKHQ